MTATVCILVRGTGDKQQTLLCQPIDAKEHMKNGWVLAGTPPGVSIGVREDKAAAPKAEAVPEAKKTEAKKTAPKGEASININGEEDDKPAAPAADDVKGK